MKTPIKYFIVGGIIFSILFFACLKFVAPSRLSGSKFDTSLLNIHKELYTANYLTVDGEFTSPTKPEKAVIHLYMDNETGDYSFTAKTDDKLNEGYLKSGDMILTNTGNDWRQSDKSEDMGPFLKSFFEIIIAKNLMNSVTNKDRVFPRIADFQ